MILHTYLWDLRLLCGRYLHGKSSEDNAYARPLDFTPVIDLNAGKVPWSAVVSDLVSPNHKLLLKFRSARRACTASHVRS